MAAGVYANGFCHVDASAALQYWCFGVEPGDRFASCSISAGVPQISFVDSVGTLQTLSYTPALPVCDTDTHNLNPIPMGFALSGAVIMCWVAFWAFNRIREPLEKDN